jgi:hypothetical protein
MRSNRIVTAPHGHWHSTPGVNGWKKKTTSKGGRKKINQLTFSIACLHKIKSNRETHPSGTAQKDCPIFEAVHTKEK